MSQTDPSIAPPSQSPLCIWVALMDTNFILKPQPISFTVANNSNIDQLKAQIKEEESLTCGRTDLYILKSSRPLLFDTDSPNPTKHPDDLSVEELAAQWKSSYQSFNRIEDLFDDRISRVKPRSKVQDAFKDFIDVDEDHVHAIVLYPAQTATNTNATTTTGLTEKQVLDSHLYEKGSEYVSSDESGYDSDYSQTGYEESDHKVMRRLARAGYVFDNLSGEFLPMTTLPSYILGVKHRKNKKKELVAKVQHRSSSNFESEKRLLFKLNRIPSRLNHIIRIHKYYDWDTPVIILDRHTPLEEILTWSRSTLNNSPHLCQQVIEGVAFLHKNLIAHMDLSFDNLVYDPSHKQLFIIDFEFAYECTSIDEKVALHCGTEVWAAPEIIFDDDYVSDSGGKELPKISPIRADLWSCGRIIKYLCEFCRIAEGNKGFPELAKLLRDPVPEKRPMLAELVDDKDGLWEDGRFFRKLNQL